MPAIKIRRLEKEHGDLHRVIPEMVNAYGQWEAGRRLGVSGTTISRWLRQNGYEYRIVWERKEAR